MTDAKFDLPLVPRDPADVDPTSEVAATAKRILRELADESIGGARRWVHGKSLLPLADAAKAFAEAEATRTRSRLAVQKEQRRAEQERGREADGREQTKHQRMMDEEQLRIEAERVRTERLTAKANAAKAFAEAVKALREAGVSQVIIEQYVAAATPSLEA